MENYTKHLPRKKKKRVRIMMRGGGTFSLSLQDPQTPYQPITTHHLQSLLLSLFPRFKPQRKGKKRRKTHEIHSLKLS
jgi:hypothetical protein